MGTAPGELKGEFRGEPRDVVFLRLREHLLDGRHCTQPLCGCFMLRDASRIAHSPPSLLTARGRHRPAATECSSGSHSFPTAQVICLTALPFSSGSFPPWLGRLDQVDDRGLDSRGNGDRQQRPDESAKGGAG